MEVLLIKILERATDLLYIQENNGLAQKINNVT